MIGSKRGQYFLRRASALAFALSLLAQASGQQPQRPAPQQEDEEVVRITSNLIQVDAVVLDSHGRQVTDLTASDFELLEDGRAQAITNFSYVTNEPEASAGANAQTKAHIANAKNSSRTAPTPPARLRPGSQRRTIAFIVDDLGLSFVTTEYVRQFLRQFIKEQMRPGDLVAVIRTGAGVGALQQFTSDPRLVERAVERVRYTPGFRAPTGQFAAPADATTRDAKSSGATDDSKERTDSKERANVEHANSERSDSERSDSERADSKERADSGLDRDALFTVGTLGALNYVLRGTAELPGRKAVVLISENARVFKLNGRDASVRDYLQRMADLANRSSATVYDLDASDLTPASLGSNLGIITAMPSAPAQGAQGNAGSSAGAGGASGVGSPSNLSPAEALSNDRELSGDHALYETRAALRYLAMETGGAQVFHLERVLEDQKGYYL